MEHLRQLLQCTSANLKLGLVTLKQGERGMTDYAQELERRAKDAGYGEEDAKVILAASLNQQTLIRLDTYVTASFPGQIHGTETMMERLARIPYGAMLNFLK